MADEAKTPDERLNEQLDEQLVAYLDGELDTEAARQLEARLACDESLRNRLKQMSQSWDLLDQLPRSNVDEKFARTTVQTVTLAIAQQVQDDESTEPSRRRWRWIGGGSIIVVGAVAGFFLVSGIYGRPNERLLRDLPVIENVELYRQAGDLDFLHKLLDENLFVEEPSDEK
jgi:anti-sigma factor RsiW